MGLVNFNAQRRTVVIVVSCVDYGLAFMHAFVDRDLLWMQIQGAIERRQLRKLLSGAERLQRRTNGTNKQTSFQAHDDMCVTALGRGCGLAGEVSAGVCECARGERSKIDFELQSFNRHCRAVVSVEFSFEDSKTKKPVSLKGFYM